MSKYSRKGTKIQMHPDSEDKELPDLAENLFQLLIQAEVTQDFCHTIHDLYVFNITTQMADIT